MSKTLPPKGGAKLYRMSEVEYHRDPFSKRVPALSSSTAKLLVDECPAYVAHHLQRLGGEEKPPSTEMEEGTVGHCLISGNEPPVRVVNFLDFKTKAAREQRDDARRLGLVPMVPHRYAELQQAAKVIRKRILAFGYPINKGRTEQVIAWWEEADDGTPVLCRGMLDKLWLGVLGAEIADFKKIRSANPVVIQRHLREYGYDIQQAAYTSAVTKLRPELAGRVNFTFLFFCPDPPYLVTPCKPSGSIQELGEMRWRRAVNTWAKCLKTKKWPGYTETFIQPEAPVWAMNQEWEREMAE